REKAIGRRNDFVTRLEVDGHQCGEQRVRAGRDADGVSTTGVRGNLAFERLDLGTENETLRLNDAIEGGANFIADGSVLGFQVDQRYVHDSDSINQMSRSHQISGPKMENCQERNIPLRFQGGVEAP